SARYLLPLSTPLVLLACLGAQWLQPVFARGAVVRRCWVPLVILSFAAPGFEYALRPPNAAELRAAGIGGAEAAEVLFQAAAGRPLLLLDGWRLNTAAYAWPESRRRGLPFGYLEMTPPGVYEGGVVCRETDRYLQYETVVDLVERASSSGCLVAGTVWLPHLDGAVNPLTAAALDRLRRYYAHRLELLVTLADPDGVPVMELYLGGGPMACVVTPPRITGTP
ncbi:hypothetical protein JW905_01085, partial [bacterium]|nr:hypothetical protein [candidate division CSSED10-310 bacterium]